MTAFAGHLAVGEVLLLWDRIIGFDSLLPVPLLAVAVLAFRRQVSLPHAVRSCMLVQTYWGLSIGWLPLCILSLHNAYQPSRQEDCKVGLLQLLLQLC